MLKIHDILEKVKKLDKDTLNMYTLPRAEKRHGIRPDFNDIARGQAAGFRRKGSNE
jgi:hypothetical protein